MQGRIAGDFSLAAKVDQSQLTGTNRKDDQRKHLLPGLRYMTLLTAF
jgi:hypothetical protein